VTGSRSFRLGVNYWPAGTAMYWCDDELTWYEGLPRTLEQAYGQWREKRSALTEVTEGV